jgi:hypothetical protein
MMQLRVSPDTARAAGHDRPRPRNRGSLIGGPLTRHSVLELQRTAGNAAVSQLLIQRLDVSGTEKTKAGYEVPRFEFSGGEQKLTAETTGGWVDLAWDPAANVFLCTFRMNWRKFPENPGWEKPENQNVFKERFSAAVKAVWENKFPLTEYRGETATGRRAKVMLKFEDVKISTPSSVAEITALSKLPGAEFERRRSRFDVEVEGQPVRDSVTAGSIVQIDAGSLQHETVDMSHLRTRGALAHYANEKLAVELPKDTSIKQTTAVHEFGHMIGLADEYVMSREDYEEAKTKHGADEARRRLRERTRATTRIMNIGSAVSREEYRPFARWLSDLTGGDWRV